MSILHVICRIGDSEYAFPADDVYQMETYTGATPVPGAPSFILGIVQVRQQIIPVLDVRARFGLTGAQTTLESRIIVLKQEKRMVGALVDSAREVQSFTPEQFQVSPEIISKQSAGFVKSVIQLKNRIIMLLDTRKVIGEEAAHA